MTQKNPKLLYWNQSLMIKVSSGSPICSNSLLSDAFFLLKLLPGMSLEIGTQHILFTDIVGSTAFYKEVGDTIAFIEGRKHFSKMFQLVENQNGTVVKTIGDAVMAAFQTPKDAFLTAEQIQLYFRPNNKETKLRLRITIHSGQLMAIRELITLGQRSI